MLVAAALSVAACGGSGKPTANASKLLAQSLSPRGTAIRSGNLSMTVSLRLNGVAALHGQPISLDMSGPFDAGPNGPAFDLNATLSYAGEAVPLGVEFIDKAVYVEFGGTYYSVPVPASELSAASDKQAARSEAAMLAKLGINPRNWLTNPRVVGTATVGGVATTHLTAQLDVAKMLGDVSTLLSHACVTAKPERRQRRDWSERAQQLAPYPAGVGRLRRRGSTSIREPAITSCAS